MLCNNECASTREDDAFLSYNGSVLQASNVFIASIEKEILVNGLLVDFGRSEV